MTEIRLLLPVRSYALSSPLSGDVMRVSCGIHAALEMRSVSDIN